MDFVKINEYLFAACFIGLTHFSCSNDRERLIVEKQEIVEAVYSSIVVEPSEMYTVNASVSGYIDKVLVSIGDSVKTNDVLFTINNPQFDAAALNAKLIYDASLRNYSGDLSLLEDLKLEIESAKLRRVNDSINHSRNRNLYNENVITKVEFEKSKLMFDNSIITHKTLLNRLKRAKNDLLSNLNQAKNTYFSSKSRTNEAIVRTLINGVIYEIMKEPGEYIMVQQPLAQVGSSKKFDLKMLIDEVDITKVKLGQDIIVSLEAYADEVFKAKVTHISPKMDLRTQTFEIIGEFVSRPKTLYLGLTGEANIVINERTNAIVIPKEYLLKNSSVETDSGIIPVEIGIKSLSHVEVLSGIQSGDIIYKPE